MIRKASLAAALTLVLATTAFADTPIGPGVTGMNAGGAPSPGASAGASSDSRVAPDGSPATGGRAAANAGQDRQDRNAPPTHGTGSAGVGGTGGISGSGDVGGTLRGGARAIVD
ncbi:MAG: hypothetical protein JWO70_5081 [Betaproteobacteria bacterium]|nr:hypothetical protein [Betaproteobacteria bacterium]